MGVKAKIIDISRLRVELDGKGVRTLVSFKDCPLNCKWCINKSMREEKRSQTFTPASLLETVKIDNLYFKASGGGITFGGGEPALESQFISGFRRICNPEWTIFIETSLNVPQRNIAELAEVIDYWYIDIKDINPAIYRNYTEHSNKQVISNLKFLVEKGLASKITIRIPGIPGYNTKDDVNKSMEYIKGLGINSIDTFCYSNPTANHDYTMGDGPVLYNKFFKPPLPQWVKKLLLLLTIITTVGVGCICLFLIPAKVMAIIGAILVSLVVLIILFFNEDEIAKMLIRWFDKEIDVDELFNSFDELFNSFDELFNSFDD